MIKIRVHHYRALRGLCALAGLALLARTAFGQDQDDWWQHLRVGVPILVNVKAHFSENGQFNLNSEAGATGVSGVNHVYDDGYVKVDATGDAGGYTGYWGYQNASQYNAAAHTLTMESDTAYTTSGSADKDAQPFAGFEVAYGTDLWRFGSARIGWELGGSLMPIHITDDQPLPATVNQSLYTFSTTSPFGPIIVPTAPYNGGSSGEAEPTIQDTATAAGSASVPGTITGTRQLQLMLYTIRLGPTFSWNFVTNTALQIGAGPAVGILTGNYKFDETITTAGGSAENSGSLGATKTVFGEYVNASLTYRLVEHGDIYIGAQFMPLGNVNLSFPGRQASLDLRQAVQFSAGINWPF
jgi:hypothetical protein